MTIVFLAPAIFSGCIKHHPAAGSVTPADQAAMAEAQKIVVAKVNNAELHMDALVKMMNRLPGKSDGSQEPLEERKKRALDSLVLLELAYQRANTLGLGIDPYKIELAIGNFKDNVGGDKEYAEYLANHGITEAELRSEIERGLTVELIYSKEVAESIVMPEETLREEYEKEKHRLLQPEKVSVIDVYLLKNEGTASQKKVRDLLAMIKANTGQDPWKLILDGTFLVRKLVVRQDPEKELYDAAKKLKLHELSDVISTSRGFHIIKLESSSPERMLTFDEAKPKIAAQLKGPALEKKTREWEQELKRNAKIEIM
jgi:parvulin-like peptidyl-prolyl isomerase